MTVNWLDFVLLIIVVGAVVAECRRGFGRSVFDFAAVLIAFIAAKIYHPGVAQMVHPFSTGDANQALGFALILLPGMTITLILGDLAYNSLLVSTDVFERLLGGLCGLMIGLALAHALAFWLWLGTGRNMDRARLFSSSAVAHQFLTFQCYHEGMDWLTHLGQQRPDRDLPM